MNRYLLIACLGLFVFSSCHNFFGERIHGNGAVRQQNRSVGDFNGVDVGGNIDVYVKQGAEKSVSIETDENLFEYIETETKGGKLVIRPRNGVNLDPTGSIKVFVSGPEFTVLHASGASKIVGDGKLSSTNVVDIHVSGASEIDVDLKSPKVDSDISGASELRLAGETKDFSIECSGASNAKCYSLMTENAIVDISGASSAEVFASVELDGEASGASDLKYKGNPRVKSHKSGASSINKAD